MKRIYTAESVTSGHPDKLADLIADSILDECLSQDSESRVACEVMLSYDKCILAGEITTKAKVDYIEIAKEVIKNVGYDETSIEYESRIHKQSTDINNAVSKNEQGAGDQGIVYGYAIKETDSFMPLPITLANRIIRRLEEVRRKNIIEGLLPDGKSQVSIEFDDEKIIGIKSIIISAQHKKSKNVSELKQEIKNLIIDYVFEDYDLTNTEILINPSGRFVLGGFKADTGLTGRKLMVDTYGGRSHHGGGAFSGKDPSKVDRSGAYFARYIAKNIVAAGLAYECEVALSYAIGVNKPTSIDINTFYTNVVKEEAILDAVKKVFDLRVSSVIEKLDLKCPVYSQTSIGGHFGKEYFLWENTDKAQKLLDVLKE